MLPADIIQQPICDCLLMDNSKDDFVLLYSPIVRSQIRQSPAVARIADRTASPHIM